MKYIQEYNEFNESYNELDYLILSLEEKKLFSKIGNWMFKAPKIKKLMSKANGLKTKAAKDEVAIREKIKEKLENNEYIQFKDMKETVDRKVKPLLDTAEEFEKDAKDIAGDNVYLNKIFRIEQFKGIRAVNDIKYESASEDEKWMYDNFEKVVDKNIKKDTKDVKDRTKGRGKYDDNDVKDYDEGISKLTLKFDEIIKSENFDENIEKQIDNVLRAIIRVQRGKSESGKITSKLASKGREVDTIMRRYEIGMMDAIDYLMIKDISTAISSHDALEILKIHKKDSKGVAAGNSTYDDTLRESYEIYKLIQLHNITYEDYIQILDIKNNDMLETFEEAYEKWNETNNK